MILDSFFAFAAVIEAALLVVFVIVASSELRRRKSEALGNWRGYVRALDDVRRWEEAYYAKAAQAEAYLGQIAAFDHDNDGRIGGGRKGPGPIVETGYIVR